MILYSFISCRAVFSFHEKRKKVAEKEKDGRFAGDGLCPSLFLQNSLNLWMELEQVIRLYIPNDSSLWCGAFLKESPASFILYQLAGAVPSSL